MLDWKTLVLGTLGAVAIASPSVVTGQQEQPGSAISASPGIHHARLVLLGTAGGPIIRLTRSQPSNLLVVDGTPYLIDVGAGFLRNLAASGYSAQDVDAAFITHQHLDHNGGLADFIQFSSFGQRTRPVSIVGPRGTEDMTHATFALLEPSRRAFRAEGLSASPDPRTVYQAKDVAGPGLIYQDGNVKVWAAENSHYRFIPPGSPSFGKDKSFGLRFETASGTVVFTGDSGPSDTLTLLARGADILVTEVIDVASTMRFADKVLRMTPASRARTVEHMELEHMTPEEVGKMAQRAEVKMVVLTHLAPGRDDEVSTESYVDGVRKYYRGPVIAGRDLTEIDLLPSK